jgi:hypothetical protein
MMAREAIVDASGVLQWLAPLIPTQHFDALVTAALGFGVHHYLEVSTATLRAEIVNSKESELTRLSQENSKLREMFWTKLGVPDPTAGQAAAQPIRVEGGTTP